MKSLSLHEGEKEEELQLSGRLVFQGGMIKKKKKTHTQGSHFYTVI